MKKTIEVIKEKISDCGICSLASIIKYYKGNVPLETLRYETKTNNEGVNAYELINVSKKYGFNSYGEKVVDIKNKRTPFIAHLKLENDLYHFIVVYKISNNNLLIMDPKIGLKRINIDEFNKEFTGVILNFIPIGEIPKYKENKFIIKKILNNIKNSKISNIFILIISFIILLLTTLINLEVELLKTNKNIIYLFLIIVILNEILILIKNNLLINKSIKFNKSIIKDFVIHIFKLPSNYLKLKQNGEIVTRFNELNDLSNNIYYIILEYIFNIILSIIIFILIYIKSNNIICIILIFTIMFIVFNKNVYKKMINEIKYSLTLESDYNSNIIDFISNINTIKNLNVYDYFIKNIDNNLSNKNIINKRINKKIFMVNFINNIMIGIINLIIIYYIIFFKDSISNSLLIYVLFNYYINIIKNIIDFYPTILLYKTIIKKNSDFLSFQKNNNPLKIKNCFNNINISNLIYSVNGKNILYNINFNIKNKDKILINGPSGIGKSTLMKILNKEIENYKGKIYFDQFNIREYDVKNIITYVEQDESLFNDTILNNILLGKRVSKEELEKVIKICRIDKINIVKEIGLEALIINNSCISGGEKNRIILARSLIHSNNILILDEILKETDYKLEIEITKDIINHYKDKTIIYISHKNVRFLFNKVLTLGKE